MTTRTYCDGCTVELNVNTHCQLRILARNASKDNVFTRDNDLCEYCLGIFIQNYKDEEVFLPVSTMKSSAAAKKEPV